MKRSRAYVFVAASLLLGGEVIGYVSYPVGVKVTIRNMGHEMLRNVAVQVTGRTYSIGDLAPGNSRSRRVSPTGESSVEIAFMDDQGRPVHLDAIGYIETGSRGRIDIEVRDRRLGQVKDEVGVY